MFNSECEMTAVKMKELMTGGVESLEPFEQKVIGLKWNYESDELLLTFDKLIESSKTMTPTKRNLLKLSA